MAVKDQLEQTIKECKRQEESCKYTSTALFEWTAAVSKMKLLFMIIPIVLGTVAVSPLFVEQWLLLQAVASISAFLAGLLPLIYIALEFDTKIARIIGDASEYKNLQDRFRQAAAIHSQGYLPRAQFLEMDDKPEMCLQFAHFLADELKKKGHEGVEIYAEIKASLHGRKHQNLIEVEVDLAKEPRNLWRADWIVPLESPLPGPRGLQRRD